jgi:hypothetical protein
MSSSIEFDGADTEGEHVTPSEFELYAHLREDLAGDALAQLGLEVRTHYEELVGAQQRNELVAVDLAELLCVRLEILLSTAHMLDTVSRANIVGAARYFISNDDVMPDDHTCTGLDDDVGVFNHVVRELKRFDLVITE